MKTINLIKVFIASPGDIAAKRNEVEETIYRWNIENTDNTKVILMPIRWETNAIPTYINNSSGQSVINKQIVENSDILLAIFGHKLGSPVDNYRSGTIAEIDYFYKNSKGEVGIFFLDEPVPQILAEEYIEVKKYRDSLEDKGFYGTYSKDNIRRFLTKKVNHLIEKAQNNLESKRFDLDSISYKTSSAINKKVIGTDEYFEDNLDIFDPIEFDNDERLLLIYAFMDENSIFSTDNSTYRKVVQWESDNNLRSYLSDRVFDVLEKLSKSGILKEEYDSSFDEYPSRYILISEDYKKFKRYFLKNEKKISVIMEKYKAPIQADPFSNLDESDLPF
ncbi:DUF4062 domain-containing protein [Vagococcus carniphilus]|uniref:DUF4062 domain-containing protein n=1 Tax=Vagococcus carniphilus TaxID=218144 RepID=UPI003B59C7DE